MNRNQIIPTVEQCQEMKASYTSIPLSREYYSDLTTPIGLLNSLKQMSPQCFLLESVENEEKWGRCSYTGFDPVKTVTCKNGKVKINGKPCAGQPMDIIRRELEAYKSPKLPYLPSFSGGFVGYFGYDSIQYFEKAVHINAVDQLNFDDISLMLFDKIICFDHLTQKLTIVIHIPTDDLEFHYKKAEQEFQRLEQVMKTKTPLNSENPVTGEFHSNMAKEEYMSKVMKIKEYIHNGDIFQAVLAQRFQARFSGDLLNVYRVLRTTNPSPYMYYLNLGGMEIAGTSPETLVKVYNGEIQSYPIAGTRKRGATPEEDMALSADLLADEKELSEHNMLVDLARNDVGRVSKFGSVKVSEYIKIKKFSHVMHITSLVTGQMQELSDSISVFESVFPAGTLSGAPKISAMHIIDELEGSTRGVYGGAIGYIDFAGNLDMCIAIRTIVKKDDEVYVGAGGGIVYDSMPESEYQECLNKAGAMFQALEIALSDKF